MLIRTDVETALHYMDAHGLIRLSKPTNSWYMMHCPFHSGGNEKKPSCGCSLEGAAKGGVFYPPGRFNCFACGASYSFGAGIKEILKLKGTSISAHPDLEPYTNENFTKHTGSLIPEDIMTAALNTFAADNLKIRAMNKPKYVTQEELAQYRFIVPYMYQRKLTNEVIDKYDVGFDGNYQVSSGRIVPCITFPVRDVKGNTLFICRRSIEGKFFFLPRDIEKPVYGMYELPPETKEVIICESIFNALTCVVYGHPAVALFGTGTPYQFNQLKKLGVNSYVICMDNDDAGNRGAAKVKRALKDSAFVWTMHVPEGKDANDLEYSEFVEAYNNRD